MMQSMKITAKLRNGFASNDPWSPSIDGILAYWWMREKLGEEMFFATSVDSGAMHAVDDLPLAKTRWQGDWWYQCSSPIYETRAEFLRYFHRRFDMPSATQFLLPQRSKIETRMGPFKNYRLSTRVIVTPDVVWYAVGDIDEVRRLLRLCSAIGCKIGTGFGRVSAWTIEPCNEVTLSRPVPVEYAREHGIDGPAMWWGIRPPARIRENSALCVMPR